MAAPVLIMVSIASPFIGNCKIIRNNASSGGGIFNYGEAGEASPVLINCEIKRNAAAQGGLWVMMLWDFCKNQTYTAEL